MTGTTSTRHRSLDTLRGFAVALMIVDHFAVLVLSIEVEVDTIRFATRLCEPLFAVLVGYFLAGRGRRRLTARMPKLVYAAVAANLLFFPTFGVLEILATFLVIFALYLAVQEHLIWALPAAWLIAIDPSQAVFDYPLSIVLAQVALGMWLRNEREGRVPAWLRRVPGGALALSAVVGAAGFATPYLPNAWMAAFTVPAVALVRVAELRPEWEIAALTWVGQRPLLVYVAQFLVIFGLAIVAGRLGGGSDWVERELRRGLHEIARVVR